jgi:hypothetical protein
MSSMGSLSREAAEAGSRHTVGMASELEELRRSLDGLRASVPRKLTGLSEADARRSTVPSGTNLAGLVQHLTLSSRCGSKRLSRAVPRGGASGPWRSTNLSPSPHFDRSIELPAQPATPLEAVLLSARRSSRLTLVNAREAKTVPGRKTDVADAEWLADLGEHGLVRASLVPPPPIRELGDLTRTRAIIGRDRAREVQRLEKLLEDAQIKWSYVVTDLCGVASRRILTALMSGVTDPAALVRPLLLNRIDQHNAAIQHLKQRIEQKINSVQAPRDLLTSIPGGEPDGRRYHHRRDRRRHDRLSRCRTPLLLGRGQSRAT